MANEYNYNAPEVELEVLSVTGDWNPEDFVFSLTSNTELLKKGTLFIKAADSGTNVVASVINFSNTGDSDYAIRTPLTTPSNSLVSALPVSGVETTSNFTIASRDLLTSIFVDDVEKVRVTLTGTSLDNLTVSGDLVVSGTLTAEIPGLIDLSQPLALGSSLTVTGSTSLLDDLSVSGNSYLNVLSVSGSAGIESLTVTGSTTLLGGLDASGLTTLSGLSVGQDADVLGDLTVSGDLTVAGMIYADLGTTIDLSSPVELGSTLEVTGATTLLSTLSVADLATVSGLVVQNDVDVTGNVTITGNLTVSGNIISDSLPDPFDPSLALTLGSTLNVSGATTLENTLVVSGSSTLHDSLNVSGLATLSGLTVQNDVDVTGNVAITGSLTVSGGIISSTITDLENDVAAHEDRLDVMDIIDGTDQVVVFENTTAVFADAHPGIQDPDYREGWYFKNEGPVGTNQNKVNWYFDGHPSPIHLDEFSVYAIVTFDSVVSKPHLAIYTEPQGVGDAAPWYRSKRVYVSDASAVVGVKYLMYVGEDPKVRPDLPRLTTTLASSEGPQAPTETILAAVLGSDSATAIGNCEFVAEAVGSYSPNFKRIIKLDIRKPSVTNVQTWDADVLADSSLYTDNALVDLTSNPLVLGSTLEVTGIVTLLNDLNVSGLTTLSGLVVQNDIDVTGNVSITGNLVVSGNIVSDSLPDPFDPSLALTLGSTLNVSGATTLETTLVVSGASTLRDTLSVSGLTTVSGLVVQNDVDVTGNVGITGDVTILGTLSASNFPGPGGGSFDPSLPLELGSTLTVTGVTTLRSGLIVSDDIKVSGLVIADGFTSYISSGADINTGDYYAPLVNLSLQEKDDFTSFTLLVAQDGGSSGTSHNSALIHVRIKQQADMETAYVTPPDTVTLSEAGVAEWSAVAEATSGYEYQFTLSSTPDSLSWAPTLNLTESEDISIYGGDTVYVHVKASGGISHNSDSVYVNYAAPTSVTLSSNGEGSWSSVSGAPGYQYQLSSVSSATGTWSSEVLATSVSSLNFLGFTGTTAYLHVRVTDSTNSSYGSAYIPFSAPTGISLNVDGDSAWFAVTDATNYQYQYTTSATPSLVELDWSNTTNLFATEDISSFAGTEVFVHVRVSGTGNDYGSASAVAAGVPTNLVFNTYTSGISWDAVNGANLVGGYKYKVTTYSDPDLDPSVWVTTPSTTNVAMLDSYSAGQTVYLHVKVANSEVYASLSQSMPTAIANVLLNTSTRTATWDEPVAGLFYQYQINQSTTPNALAWVSGSQPLTVNLTQYASNQQVYFHVRASGLTATQAYDDATMPLVTINASTGEANWDLIPGADGSYQYQVRTTSAPMAGMWINTDNPPETVSLAAISEGQTFYFFVQASGGSFYNYTSGVKPTEVVSGLTLNVGLMSSTGNWTYNPAVLYQYQFASSATPNEGTWSNTQFSPPPVMGSSSLVNQGELLYFIVQKNNTPGSRSSISGARPYYSAPTNVTFNSTGYATWDQVMGASSYQYQIGTASTPTGVTWTTAPFSFPPSVQTDVSAYNGQTVYFFVRVSGSINYGSASALINTGGGGGMPPP